MRTILISFLIILMTQPPICPPVTLFAAQSPQIDPSSTYRLTNDYAAGKSLAYSKRGDQYVLTMDDTRESREQCWNLTPAGNGAFRLTNLTAGGGKSLDTPGSGNQYGVTMADTGNYSGQMWMLIPVGNGKYRLTNLYAGLTKSLDASMSGSQYVMSMADAGNSPGQTWTLTKVTPPVAVAPGSVIVPPQIATPQIALPLQVDLINTFRLTSTYLAEGRYGKSLSVSKSGDNYDVVMTDTKDLNDQIWKFISLGNGKFRLTNLSVGDSKSLDTQMRGNRYVLSMQNTGTSTGQIWSVFATAGKYRLTNDALGPGMSLNISAFDPSFSQFLLQMGATTNSSKQSWTLTKVMPQLVQPPPIHIPISKSPPDKPLTVTGLTWAPSMIPKGGGKLICSDSPINECGLTKADWVGSHVLSTTCEKGFYDPIWGGTCWDFPADDGEGKWIRSTDAVTSDTAVWRSPKESVAKATRVTRGTAFSGNCPSDTFWDGYDTGGCWKCTDKHPRRTLAPVWADNACATSINETAHAVFLKYNGCPNPNAASMGLAGKRMPGKPFLHVGSGCYTCPNADEEGNILFTERNAKPITGDAYANNQGCTILFKWKPPEFPEPGLSGLDGVKEILLEKLILVDPDPLTLYLTKVAEELGHKANTPQSTQYVAQQWQEIVAAPYKSPALENLLFGFLEVTAEKDAGARTPAEKVLVKSVEEYVRVRRTFIAEQALAMYDAWKADDDRKKGVRARGQLEVLFDYGTVPLDFRSAALAGFGLGADGAIAAGTIVALNRHAVAVAKIANGAVAEAQQAYVDLNTAEGLAMANRIFRTAARTETLNSGFRSVRAFRLLSMGSRFAIIGPAIAIDVAGLILLSIAIEQFIRIVEARPKLEAAVEKAKQPVDLKTLLAQPNGKDELTYFWSKAMDSKLIQEDREIVTKARAAMEVAKQRGYQISSGQ